MSAIYHPSTASERIIISARENLLQKRASIENELARVTERLIEINEYAQNQERSPIVTAKVRCGWMDYYDHGYVGSFRYKKEENRVPHYKIEMSDYLSGYLLLLACQTEAPLPCALEPLGKSRTDSYLNVVIDDVRLSDMNIESSGKADFRSCGKTAMKQVQEIHNAVISENPYGDIPIAINRDLLIEAITRQRIIDYCKARDPYARIEEITPSKI